MRIQAKLVLLLAVALAGYALRFWIRQETNTNEVQLMLESIKRERSVLLDRLLALTGEPLKQFAGNNSSWDEMVNFVQTADAAWAKSNIQDLLDELDAHAAWVLRPDFTPVYSASQRDSEALKTLPISRADLAPLTAANHFPHFYLDTPAGLLDVRGAPIQPSADSVRATTPRGWFFVARLLDEPHVKTLAALTESDLFLTPTPQEPAGRHDSPVTINLHRELRDWRGRTLRTLHLHYHPLALERMLSINKSDTFVFIIFNVTIVGLVSFAVHAWIARPLRLLGESLSSHDTAPLEQLKNKQTELGHLARLVGTSFAEHASLEHEIEERKRTEAALRASEKDLRQAMEQRVRLGRDLHDGVIQSIYAAGLGLEGVRGLLRSDPVAAEQRLNHAQKSLNDTIREVRNFITGLEPEEHKRESFTQALAMLATMMQSVRPVQITLDLDEPLAQQLNSGQEAQALQVVRESLSNALRHSQAATIHISLKGEGGGTVLEIRDDGQGFDPVQRAGAGHGLANLAARAGEMGATLVLDSAPGKGTRLALRFNSANPAS